MLKDTIKKLRIQQGLSQDELAERVHVVRQTISKWERGTSVPDADSLMALARALGVSAAELLGESAMAEKEPRDLAWETSLLDERVTSESQRLASCAPSNGRSSARRLWRWPSDFSSGCQTSSSHM